MNKSLTIWILTLLLCLISVNAYDFYNVTACFNMSNTMNDASGNSKDFTIDGSPTFNAAGGKPNGYYDWNNNWASRADDNDFDFDGGNFSVSGWFRSAPTSGLEMIYVKHPTGWIFYLDASGYLTLGSVGIVSTATYDDNTWYFFEFGRRGDNVSLWIDNVMIASTTDTTDYSNTETIYIGHQDGQARDWNGDLDTITVIKGVALTAEQRTYLYNEGNGRECGWEEEIINVTDSVEQTLVEKQLSTTTLTGPAEITIVSGNYTILNNDTDMYGTYSFTIESTHNNEIHCHLLIDGVEYTNVTRSNIAGVKGSVFMMTEFIKQNQSSHSQELVCSKTSGPGQIHVNNVIGIGHIMRDELERVKEEEIIKKPTTLEERKREIKLRKKEVKLADIEKGIKND